MFNIHSFSRRYVVREKISTLDICPSQALENLKKKKKGISKEWGVQIINIVFHSAIREFK